MVRVGLVSDTHGLLRPAAASFLEGCAHIVHAGDIGDASVLERLGALAPVTAVRGNNDRGVWADTIPATATVRIGDVLIFVIHDLGELDAASLAPDVHVVVSGHSHVPCIEQREGILFVNPGSAGPRRFKLPVSIGELVVDGRSARARHVALDLQPGSR